ncbi:MAG: class I SAM-dependent methyltransferase [Promethearchaeota archaeon]
MMSAEIYLQTINWQKRLRREIPILKEICEQKNTTQKQIRILDLGCGLGKHLTELAKYFPKAELVGIDLSSEMIQLAQKLLISFDWAISSQINFHAGDFFSQSPSNFGKFDFIYSLGNSILLMLEDHKPLELFSRINQFLAPNGLLFFQILNNSKPRKGYVPSPICHTQEGDNFYTIKRFDPNLHQNQMEVEFVEVYQKKNRSKPEVKAHKSFWPLISNSEIAKILSSFNLEILETWGSYNKIPFSSSKHDSLLLLAQKRNKNSNFLY